MVCNKCSHKLPDDSEFCQYCGSKIEEKNVIPEETTKVISEVTETSTAVTADPVENDELNFDNMTREEALKEIFKIQAKETVRAMEANSRTQPDNEDDEDFGLVPGKPIFTHALMSVEGEKEYLNKLHTINGEKIKYNRRCSMSVDGINGLIDVYDTYLPSGQPYKTIYINMYGAKKSTKAPVGFVLNNATVQTRPILKKEQAVKIKYCSRCGSVVDNKTKACTGCGKQYFRGFRISKFSITVIALAIVIATISMLCVLQHVNIQTMQDQISELEGLAGSKQLTIDRLEREKDDLESDLWEYKDLALFIDNYVVFVEDDGTNLYHKYDCYRFKGNSFRVFNTEAAKGRGYSCCQHCHRS